MSDWDDWRFALALSRDGKASTAAQTLGVDPTTVLRRVRNLEQRLGVRLFEQRGHTYQPTEHGRRLVQTAEHMETEIRVLEADLGIDRPLQGSLRIMTSEDLMAGLLDPYVARFKQAQPELKLDLIIDSHPRSLAYYEADIAVRTLSPRHAENERGEKICDVAWSCYASEHYLEEHGHPGHFEDLADHRVLAPINRPRVRKWLEAMAPPCRPSARSNSLLTLREIAIQGLGVVVLPCFLGNHRPDLQRLFEPIGELAETLWLVSHQNVRQTARVQAFFSQIEALDADDLGRLQGWLPPRERARPQ